MTCECDKLLDRIVRKFKRNKNVKQKNKQPKIAWKRSFLKGCTWEFCCFFVLGTMVYMLTGDFTDVCTTVIAYHIFKIFFYTVHERLWNRSPWGIKYD